MTDDFLKGREVIIELVTVGTLVKATAFDVATLREVSISGPASSGEEALRQGALRRLAYVLKKDGIGKT